MGAVADVLVPLQLLHLPCAAVPLVVSHAEAGAALPRAPIAGGGDSHQQAGAQGPPQGALREQLLHRHGACNEALDNSGVLQWMENRIYEYSGIKPRCWVEEEGAN